MKTTLLIIVLLAIYIIADAQLFMGKPTNENIQTRIVTRHKSYGNELADGILLFPQYYLQSTVYGVSQKQKLDSVEFAYPDAGQLFRVREKEYYFYNDQGQNNLVIGLDGWSGSEFVEVYRKDIIYSNDEINAIIGYNFNVTSGNKSLSDRIKCTYNAKGQPDSVQTDFWDNADSTWRNKINVKYIYNEMEMVSTTIQTYTKSPGVQEISKMEYYYHEDTLIMKEKYVFDTLKEKMVLNYQTELIYENGLLSKEANSFPNYNNVLNLANRMVYLYNPDSTIQRDFWEYYDKNNDRWVVREANDYTYSEVLTFENTCLTAEIYMDKGLDPYFKPGLPIKIISYLNYDESTLGDSQKMFYYSDIESGYKEKDAPLVWSVYPNPTHDLVYLNSINAASAKCTILDALGRVVLSQQVSTGQSVDLGSVKAGYYLLQLNDGTNNAQVIKIIKQ
jgi:hypothetical protein